MDMRGREVNKAVLVSRPAMGWGMAMTDTSWLRVSIVEDDDATREGLTLLLDGTPGFRSAGFVRVPSRTRSPIAHPTSPDVIVLDVNLPGMSGADGVAPCARRHPRTSILMFSMYDGDDEVFTALCNGASGYLLKRTAPDRLLEAIREAAQDGAPMSPSVARRVLRLFRETTPRRGAVSS